ncbi:MAG TPA: hypothetical protein PKH07_12265, partial [bacterium]|nr:hypothetical protein [bacterium]
MKRQRDEMKDISGCAISGIMSERRERFSGDMIIRSIATMHERSNGLGGGFAAYGIYPDLQHHYAIHVMCDSQAAKEHAEELLKSRCRIYHEEPIP